MFSYLPKELFFGDGEEKKLEFLIRDVRNWTANGLQFDKGWWVKEPAISA